ncbi:hypothetical protein [Candidatus Entotheonella palauensis]|uniref:Carrier domain-containing protein n=1 Tax=Candidatus Entotheonella gemina TaxID=1429439 RepID=W4M774_9BACT|nr:hypothetical protein [Candidatus Entotheonella palauensis]ETX06028.1 MAG: hypothetical protein ETSY2_19550 [Candidatus Entotheonella gemina]
MSMELINWVRYELGVLIAIATILEGDVTIADLARQLLSRLPSSRLVEPTVEPDALGTTSHLQRQAS